MNSNLPPGCLPQDIDGPQMPKCLRCGEEVNTVNDVGLCEDCEAEAETECKRCGDQYILRDGEEPTEFCDRCAHKVVEELRVELVKCKIEAWKQGMTDAAEIVGLLAIMEKRPTDWGILRKKAEEIIAARDGKT